MERSGTEVSSAPEVTSASPTNPSGLQLGRGGSIPQARAAESTSGAAQEATTTSTRTSESLEKVAERLAGSAAVPKARLDRHQPDYEPPSTRAAAEDAQPEGRRRRGLWILLLVLVCCTLGATVGAGLALADHRAVQRVTTLTPLLAAGAVAVQQVDSAGQPFDPPRLIDLLTRLQSANAAVERVTSDRSWMIATSTTRRASLAAVSDRADGLSMLSDAAGPLRESLKALSGSGGSEPDRLDSLARDLNRFASVSLRAQQLGTYPAPTGDAGTPFVELATAAAVLPTMAGSEARRYWTVCPYPTGSCTRFAIRDGRVVGRPFRVQGILRNSGAADITVVGRTARELVVGQRLSVTDVLDTLVTTDPTAAGADDSSPVVTSAVPVEQHALTVIAGT